MSVRVVVRVVGGNRVVVSSPGAQGVHGPSTDLTIGNVTTVSPGGSATASVTGVPPDLQLDLGIPRGDKGEKGDTGATNSLSVGTVTTGAPGSSASITITGTAPNQTLSMSIPRGDTGPANSLSVGTVTTGVAGSSAAASISGTAPTQTLNLTIPKGDKGDTGPVPAISIGTVTTGSAAVSRSGTDSAPVLNFVLPAVGNGSITPITLGGGYVEKTASYTLSDDDHEIEFTSAPATATLPSATGRAGRQFIIRNSAASGTITVSGASVTIPGKGYVTVRSNGTTWDVIEGAYATSSVGLASYRWNAASAAWRLIAYDSGIRNITADLANGWAAGGGGYVYVRRTTSHTTVSIYYITGASATSATFITLASGFQFTPTLNALARTNSGTNALVVATSTMTFTGSYTSYADVEATLSGPATPTLPTSLPGTTVTSPV